MADCEILERCPIFRKSKAGILDSLFITLYCKGIKLESCERRLIMKKGVIPPDDLLPNGEYAEMPIRP